MLRAGGECPPTLPETWSLQSSQNGNPSATNEHSDVWSWCVPHPGISYQVQGSRVCTFAKGLNRSTMIDQRRRYFSNAKERAELMGDGFSENIPQDPELLSTCKLFFVSCILSKRETDSRTSGFYCCTSSTQHPHTIYTASAHHIGIVAPVPPALGRILS